MKAIVRERYGHPDVLRLGEVDTPVAEDDEVLVGVHAASVNPYDWHFMTGIPYIGRPMMGGVRRPESSRLGADLAGRVVTVGRDVTRFGPGDEVFGEVNGEEPGHPRLELGSLAEYVCVSEDRLEPKPPELSFEQASAVPLAAITALQGLRDYGRVEPGQKVLINGASGGVGTFAVQIAKAYGTEVTGVCSSGNVEMVRSIGSDHVVDYTREDFAAGGPRYDLILDNVGNRALSDCRRVLTPQGMYLASFGRKDHRWFGPLSQLLGMAVSNRFSGQTLVQLDQDRNERDLASLRELIEAGKVTPVIDRTYELAATPEAMRHLGEGHARGKIVITV